MQNPTAIPSPEWMREHEVSALLSIPVRTLQDWRLKRLGPPSYKLGRAVRYRRGEVLAWADSHRQGDPAA